MLDKRNFYINGKWVSPSKSNDFEVIDPSTEEPFAEFFKSRKVVWTHCGRNRRWFLVIRTTIPKSFFITIILLTVRRNVN